MTTELAKAEAVLPTEPHNKPQEKDPKDKLTEFAFKLDRSLLGLPLASPWQRLIAISIDLLLIALLSDTSGELLALFIAVTFYRLGKRDNEAVGGKARGRKRRKALRITGGFILFVLLLDVTPKVFDFFEGASQAKPEQSSSVPSETFTFEEGFTIAALTTATIGTINSSDCQQLACWQEDLFPIASGLQTLTIPEKKLADAFKELASHTNLSKNQQTALANSMLARYQQEHADFMKVQETVEKVDEVEASSDDTAQLTTSEDTKRGYGYSIVSWVKGIINDLGLGFGWAAFYFTASIVIWKGQTPGKKLMGIRVVQLDGSPLSLWDSFGRYGGYGAGIATGLLGFLQIFWDPNRQAIHDKISATVVIKGAVIKNEAAKSAEVFTDTSESAVTLPEDK